jgi:L-seryl-tRNA(Ser) seleniumtransferase
VPEIMASAGVRLVEVGTTNRTHLRDYESAIDADTALLLKVHRSNFALRGFVAEATLDELAELARARGCRSPRISAAERSSISRAHGLPEEVFAPGRLARGAACVCFSGDKLLGGPQAGIILTRDAALADRLRRHPLARALRMDKLSLAALDWTLAGAPRRPRGARDSGAATAARSARRAARARRRARREARTRARAFARRRASSRIAATRAAARCPTTRSTSWVVRVEARRGGASARRAAARGSPPVLARDATTAPAPRRADPARGRGDGLVARCSTRCVDAPVRSLTLRGRDACWIRTFSS